MDLNILKIEDNSLEKRIEGVANVRKVLRLASDRDLEKFFNVVINWEISSGIEFSYGFNALLDEVVSRDIVSIEDMNVIRRSTVGWNVSIDDDGYFIDAVSGDGLGDIIRRYSLMKFGDVEQIRFFGIDIADKFVARLDDPLDDLVEIFHNADARGENVAFISPGSRNVESAQNFVYEIAIERVNNWLALNGLPTIVLVKLMRIASNVSNYAVLSIEDRMGQPSNNDPLFDDEFFARNPTHVIFGDDVRVSGATVDRIEFDVMKSGALSFSSMYNIVLHPQLFRIDVEIEDKLNRFCVSGLDSVKDILNHRGFRPVQRMVRLVLDEKNRDGLRDFLEDGVINENLVKLYLAALGNDYFLDPRYRESVLIFQDVLFGKGLVDGLGMIC